MKHTKVPQLLRDLMHHWVRFLTSWVRFMEAEGRTWDFLLTQTNKEA